jgi:hypothetical protein
VARANLVHHVVPVFMHDMGSMVETVVERHDYCQRRMEKEPVRFASPWFDNLFLLWKTDLKYELCSSDG